MLSRVITIVFGLLLSALLPGCVAPPPQESAAEGNATGPAPDAAARRGVPGAAVATTAKSSWEMTPIELPGPMPTRPPPGTPTVAAASAVAADGAATPHMNEIEPAAGSPGADSQSVPGPVFREGDKPAIDDDPERLMGVGAAELTRMLGDPRFVRRDSDAQLWRYRSETCILDLFLYRRAGHPEYLVNHVETRRHEGGAVPTHECFEKLLLERRDGQPS